MGRLRRSERLQHRVGVADLELAGLLDVDGLDDAVVDEHRIALGAHAHAACGQVHVEPERLGEDGAAVGHHPDLPTGLLVPSPGAHHEGVVDGDAPDLVYTLRAELVEVLHVARDVLGRASGGEGARQPEDRDLLDLGDLADREGVRAAGAARRPTAQLRAVTTPLVWRRGRRASQAGRHQFHRPSKRIVAGTRSARTIVASTTTATPIPTPTA